MRWIPAERLHLTLVFLGQTDASVVAALNEAVARAVSSHGPYAAASGDAGGRVDDRPAARRGGVAWLRLRSGADETAALALDVDRALDVGTYADRRPRPHLTVARNATPEALAALRQTAAELRVEWLVDRVVLFRSHTGPGGSRYEELGVHGLRGDEA